jgi:hypothetical protein
MHEAQDLSGIKNQAIKAIRADRLKLTLDDAETLTGIKQAQAIRADRGQLTRDDAETLTGPHG